MENKMSYLFASIVSRPNTEVSFFRRSSETQEYLNVNYIEPGLCSFEFYLSRDRLVRATVIEFLDTDVYENYRADTTIREQQAQRKIYDQENGIIQLSEGSVEDRAALNALLASHGIFISL
jgi:hypothetical protein